MTDSARIVIIGAGPTGLGAAYRLEKAGVRDYILLEARDMVGGLASSYVDDVGFTWDVGGHIQFSRSTRYNQLLDEILGDNRTWIERNTVIRLKARLVPYPFQLNVHHLDPADRRRAVEGMRAASSAGAGGTADFESWIYATFGQGVAELFMLPYNRKVWAYPLSKMSSEWIRDRVALPDRRRLFNNPENWPDYTGWGPNHTFSYPLRGGTGFVWRAVAETLDAGAIRFGSSVDLIDLKHRTVEVVDEDPIHYEQLISSMPLDRLCNCALGLDAAASEAAAKLIHSSVHIVGIGLDGRQPEHLKRASWIYFPGDDSPYYRVTVLSNYSPHNVPTGPAFWSLLAEVSESPHKSVDAASLVEDVVASLKQDAMIPADCRIVSRWHHREEYGYPTPTLERNAALRLLIPRLEEYDVYSRGRFGAWRYEVSNQDNCFMQGVEVVERILGIGRETTLSQA